jgi:acyl-CoA reductase-like NAD-dependent aldehyde dehydrogenase
MDPTPKAEMDSALAELSQNKKAWASLGIPARIKLLRAMMDSQMAASKDWVHEACEQKRIPVGTPATAEEWLGGPMVVMRNLRLLAEALEDIQQFGRPRLKDGAVRTRTNGQLAVEVFPMNSLDKMLYANFRAEIYMDPSVDEETLASTMATIYQKSNADHPGKVALVLGAGNVSSIGPMDVLYKLFVENQVCLLKMNPVNEYLGPHIERAFAPLVDQGYLRVVYGGAEEGDYLVHHGDIDEIHITGSDLVHDIIVWGAPGEEQDKAKKSATPKTTKRITSELGCVTPVIVLPGQWSEKELHFQASNVATQVANNASFNCNAAKLIITAASWPQKTAFLERVQSILSSVPQRYCYYPGSDQKYDAFLEAHPEAKQLGERTDTSVPWTVIRDVDPKNRDDIVFKKESWCGVFAETSLVADDLPQYLQSAVDFCNDHVWGTLSCCIIASPKTQAELGDAFEQAVADLRYGSVGVNHWAALSYGLVVTTWGAYPGHPLDDIKSGIGVVHNTMMFDKPQKTVVWGPFTMFPKPPWFVTHKNGHAVAQRITKFEYRPSFWKVPGIALKAMLG